MSLATRNTCSSARQRAVSASCTRIRPVKPAFARAGTVQDRPSAAATGVPARPFRTVKSEAASASTATASPSSSRNSTVTSTAQPRAPPDSVERRNEKDWPSHGFPRLSDSETDIFGLRTAPATGVVPARFDAAPATSPAIARTWNR